MGVQILRVSRIFGSVQEFVSPEFTSFPANLLGQFGQLRCRFLCIDSISAFIVRTLSVVR